MREADRREYLLDLNDPQYEAVTHSGGPLLILAGAGSGKTRVITVKIAYLIDELRYTPYSILAVTFTNRAAAEMRERAAGIVPAAADAMVRTFHSFGAWLLRRNASHVGISPGFTIYDDDDVVTLLRTIYPNENRSSLGRLATRISRAKDYGLSPADDLSAVSPDPEFAERYRAYEKRLREIGNVDFGDLILLPIRLLRENPEIKARIQSRYRAVLVDEYQDSNVAQYLLLRELVGDETYLCVVGDDDQSIYRFRGAEVRNILSFPEVFPGTTVVRLEENYRSSGAILGLASDVVRNNEGRLGKTLWTRRPDGPLPRLAVLYDQNDEVEYCKNLIRSRNDTQTAILYRTNAQSRLFETEFLKAGIPYRIVGSVRFYEREEVKDALGVLKTIANPRDEVAFRRVVNKPTRGVGPATIDAIVSESHAYDGDILAAAAEGGYTASRRARDGVKTFLGAVAAARATFGSGSLSATLEAAITESGLATFHEQQDEVAGTQRRANLDELINAAAIYPATADGLVEFLETIELDASRTVDPDTDEAAKAEIPLVTLITMHNTKGLEFDRVIVTGLEDGLFPRAEGTEDDIEEERRVLYVAITRARNELFLTTCRFRRVRGMTLECTPSRFLREIPSERITLDGTSGPARGLYSSRPTGFAPQRAPAAEHGEFPPGTYVYHDEYGTGVVVSTEFTRGERVFVVRFESGRDARFLEKYARLEKVMPSE